MSDKITRREFIKKTARYSALAALGGGYLLTGNVKNAQGTSAQEEYTVPSDGLSWMKAPCRFCGTGCGTIVGVKNGRVVAVQGDRENPVNRGLLCVKGYYVGKVLYGHDRLTQPLIRKNGKFETASWEEAVTFVAEKIMEDPLRFAIYGSGQWTIPEGYTAMKFLKGGLGSNHIDPNARLCMASAVTGFLTTFGVDEPSGCYDDFDECDTAIGWGNNWAEMHPILFSRVVDRKKRGDDVKLIDISTRRTRTSEIADQYIEFQPHSDLAIANGICHLLLKRGTYDKDFVSKHTRIKLSDGTDINLEQFKDFLKDYTPEKVSKISKVPVGTLESLADLFGDPGRKIVSVWCMGVNQHTRGTWMNNLIYNVHLLSGQIGKPGRTPLSLTGQPSACGTCREAGTLSHALPGGRVVANETHRIETEDFWNTKRGAINPKPGFHTVAMFKALASGELTGMWVQVTNPAQTMPNLNENLKNARDRFLIVSDVYPTVTTELADVVLPSSLWVEKNGLFGNTERRTQQWFKMVEPPGNARDDVWQMIAVARKMYEMGFSGLKDRDGNFLLSIRDENGKEIEAWKWDVFNSRFNVDRALYEDYRQFTVKKHKDVAPYDVLVKERGLRWPVVKDSSGNWKETKRRFVEGEDPFVKPGENISFYMAKAGDNRAIIWARPYEKPPESPDAEYPFWLCTGRVLEHWHTATMTGRVLELKRAMPRAYVEVHADDAEQLGIGIGDSVRIRSRRGQIVLPVSVNGRAIPQRGLVFVPFFDETKLINLVTLDEYDPISKEPDYKKCAVKLEKI
jgi:nitrate reductase NapA